MKRLFVLCPLLLSLGLLLSSSAGASVSRALSLADLVSKAEYIVVARAGQRHSRWHANGKLIVTDVDLRIERALKGDTRPGEEIIATVLGGAVDGLGMQVPGEANFETDALAVVFLYTSLPSADLRVVGMSQGVLPVRRQGGELSVLPGGAGGVLMAPDASGQLVASPDALAIPRPLNDVVGEILKQVAADVETKQDAGGR